VLFSKKFESFHTDGKIVVGDGKKVIITRTIIVLSREEIRKNKKKPNTFMYRVGAFPSFDTGLIIIRYPDEKSLYYDVIRHYSTGPDRH